MTLNKLLVLIALLCASTAHAAVNVGPFPSLVLKNQYGETSINSVIGGSAVDLNFVVDHANANGLGISGLKGNGVSAVFMNTSQTPGTGNPNPAAGYILVQLANSFTGFQGSSYWIQSPNSGASINVTTGVTAGLAYTITAVGTTSAAQWQVLGLPVGVTPAVGATFIAIASTTATGTGTIQVPAAIGSGVLYLDLVGSPSASANNSGIGSNLVLCALGATNSSTTTLVAKAPADGTVIGLHLVMTPLAGALH